MKIYEEVDHSYGLSSSTQEGFNDYNNIFLCELLLTHTTQPTM